MLLEPTGRNNKYCIS